MKNPIHAVANVDDYGASARLLAATTLRYDHGPGKGRVPKKRGKYHLALGP